MDPRPRTEDFARQGLWITTSGQFRNRINHERFSRGQRTGGGARWRAGDGWEAASRLADRWGTVRAAPRTPGGGDVLTILIEGQSSANPSMRYKGRASGSCFFAGLRAVLPNRRQDHSYTTRGRIGTPTSIKSPAMCPSVTTESVALFLQVPTSKSDPGQRDVVGGTMGDPKPPTFTSANLTSWPRGSRAATVWRPFTPSWRMRTEGGLSRRLVGSSPQAGAKGSVRRPL